VAVDGRIGLGIAKRYLAYSLGIYQRGVEKIVNSTRLERENAPAAEEKRPLSGISPSENKVNQGSEHKFHKVNQWIFG
jgi:hypothetical protein